MVESIHDVIQQLKDEGLRRSEDVQPWHGFWYHRPTRDFPPAAIRDPEDYQGGERLSLLCTQTELPAKAQKALVQRWCDVLPTLKNLKYLWLMSRVPPELFDALCQLPALEGLYIKWSGVQALEPIVGLRGLKQLHIGSSPSLAPLRVLAELPELVWLELENIRAAQDLSFLQGLPSLKGLAIAGDSNSLKYLKVQTLEPLKHLQALEWLSLSTVTVDDQSLAPLAALKQLKWLDLSNKYEMAEVARLAGARPDVRCELFAPITGPFNGLACKKCADKGLMLPTGRGKRWLCAACEGAQLQQHIEDFQSIVAAARAR